MPIKNLFLWMLSFGLLGIGAGFVVIGIGVLISSGLRHSREALPGFIPELQPWNDVVLAIGLILPGPLIIRLCKGSAAMNRDRLRRSS